MLRLDSLRVLITAAPPTELQGQTGAGRGK